MNLPQAFVERMAAQLGNELPAFLHSYEEPYYRGLRLNSAKMTAETAKALLGPELMRPVPWEEAGWYLSLTSGAGASPLHEAGAWYLQEPSAMIPAAILNPRPGERVLDLCAAPGGKSTQLGLRMQGQGSLVCNEPIHDRARILSRNVERMGIPNALVVSAYPEALAETWADAFDAIQCDAPCSGEGMFRRHPETRAEWSPESAAGCAKRQTDILHHAARMLRPGGRLVYSTCTLNRTENEGVVEAFLRVHPEFCLQPFSLPGLDAPDGMLTIYPHRVAGEGHFAALLVRAGVGPGVSWRPPQLSGEVGRLLRELRPHLPDWVHPNMAIRRSPDELELYAVPDLPQELPRAQVLRRGLHLGTVRAAPTKGRKPPSFVPDHALAMSILPPEASRIALTEAEARLYQNGQTLPAEGKGWVLPCLAGIPLGWGKVSDGVMKNHYPKGLRR